MDNKSVFNATVCIIGIALLLIHTINILLKKNRRKDENNLLIFFIFTAFHFTTYLIFTLLKANYTSDGFIIAFYTAFYIMNNVQILLLFAYTVSHISTKNEFAIELTTIINIVLFIAFVILDIINIFNHMFFYSDGGVYTRTKMMIFSQGYQFVGFIIIIIITLFNKKLALAEKIAFLTYSLLPLVAIILQNLLPGYAIAYLSIILAVEVLFLFVNVRKNMELAVEEKRNKEAEIKIMMSQIQPHFIYNTLASISTLIRIDPKEAQKGLDNFTDYLRVNLSSMNEDGLILFSDELKHVEKYLSLEKMRFDDRLNIVYDIQSQGFLLPPLTIQPIVENAVKHGILKKIEGGTVTIKSYEDEKAYVVKIIDDGVGFDPNENRSNKHIGIRNVKYRLSSMCHGDMKIESAKDKGTTVTVLIYK